MDPDNEDAAFNKKLVEDLLQQQQQQSQDQENQQDQQNQQNAESEEQESDQQEQQEQQQADQDEQQQKQQKEQQQQEQEQQELAEEDNSLDSEEEQALKQWLRRVPDDPGGLLRRKFQKQHEDRLREGQIMQSQSGDW